MIHVVHVPILPKYLCLPLNIMHMCATAYGQCRTCVRNLDNIGTCTTVSHMNQIRFCSGSNDFVNYSYR